MNEQILNHYNWSIDCESPFEISHHDGSQATGQAANIVLNQLRKDYNRLLKKLKKSEL